MKKFSRNVIVGLIFGAAGFVALTAVPASAAAPGSTTTTVSADSTTTQVSHVKSARIWEW
jgi:hypothetical protein